MTFYGDCMKMCEDFAGGKLTSCCIAATYHLTLPFSEFLTKNNMTVLPRPPSFFPRLKMKLKDCHFDTIGVIKAELQAVLNTTSRMQFKKWQKLCEWCIGVEGDYFKYAQS
jgi:hypothetical protein